MAIETIYQNVVEGNSDAVQKGVQAALDSGILAEEILKKGLISAMDDVGQRFESGDFFVPEMLIAARAMQAGMNLLKPHLVDAGVEAAGSVAIGTVRGDLHDIGKNLVAMMLEGAGFEVEDLGTNVDPSKFAEAARNGAQVVGMSALLTTTMNGMTDVIEAVEDLNLDRKVNIIVGGAPVTVEFANQIGADGFASDASGAVKKVRELLEK